jgi:hypothetical protein
MVFAQRPLTASILIVIVVLVAWSAYPSLRNRMQRRGQPKQD